jgi:hypothetical protein
MINKLVISVFTALILFGVQTAFSQEVKIEAPDGSIIISGNPSSESTQEIYYDKEGFDREGYDRQGYDRQGYDRTGYDRQGYDRNGLDRNGYDREGKYIGYKTYNEKEKESYDKGHHDNGKHKGWYKGKNNKHGTDNDED